jgi:PAS domain S-box-containing protein
VIKILIADDNSQNLYMLETVLKSCGYEVIPAKDGVEAFALALKDPPDIIVTDILMPGMDGFELCRRCKAHERLNQIPLIVYTATYTDLKDEQFALSLGADRFVTKPQQPEVLVQIVQEVLTKSPKARQVPPKLSPEDEKEVLQRYNEVLFRKLEQKVLQLEEVIARQKVIENELRESESKYRTLITQSPDGIFIVNLKGTFLAVNRIMCENLQYSEEELLSMNIWDIVPEQYVDLHKKRTADILVGKAPNEAAEYVVRGRDGVLHFVEILSAPYYEGKELTGFQGIARDITERKKAEEALRREQTMLARTEGIAQIGSWEWDIATDTVTWSDELFRIFQRDPREGAPSFAEHPAFYHPDDMARLQQAVEVAVALGTPYELELRAMRKDGETRVCVARGVAEMAPGGRAVRLFGSLQDITDRKRLEQAVEKARADFLFAVSHELKTPLFLMASAKELLEGLPAEQRVGRFLEYGEIWNRNLHRLRHLIDNLVDSQRTEGMGLKLAVSPTDLGEILRQTLKDLDFLVRQQRIRFQLQEDPLPRIPADPESIHRLFENLLTNAIKFSSLDGEVEVSLTRQGEKAVFTVRDFGPGIPAAEIPLLFQPFQRTDGSTRAVIPGTGLGLYTAKLIAGAHSGSITLTSEEGKGTKVTVRLPLGKEPEQK